MNNYWDDLITSATLGTDQRPVLAAQIGGKLGEVLQQTHRSTDGSPSNELNFLRTVAANVGYQRGGVMPLTVNAPLPAPAQPNTLPRCDERIGYYLNLTLTDAQFKPILPELLNAMIAKQIIVAENSLPALLQHGHNDTPIRPLILNVIGERGRWLAAQNRAWAYAVIPSELDFTVWETGGTPARLDLLRQVRAQDPQKGRELACSTWKEENAEFRAAMVTVLGEVGLSLDDEPFLESLLDTDKSVQVIRAASHILAYLPNSQLSQRMLTLAKQFIKITKGVFKTEIEFILPSELTPAMKRDGLATSKDYGKPEYDILYTIFARVRPSILIEASGKTASQLMTFTQKEELPRFIAPAWNEAAIRWRDEIWIKDLLENGIAVENLDKMPSEWLEKTLIMMIRNREEKNVIKDNKVMNVLPLHHRAMWSKELSALVWQGIYHVATSKAFTGNGLYYIMRLAGSHLYVEQKHVEEAEQAASKLENNHLTNIFFDFVTIYRFRYEMHQILA